MKNVAIYVDNPEVYDYPFSEERYRHSYSDLAFELISRGYEVRIVREGSYLGAGVFSGSFAFIDDNERSLEAKGEFTANLIFDKGDRSTLRDDGFAKINTRELEDLCNDKQLTARLFKDFSPKSVDVKSFKDLEAALTQIPGDIKVFKPSDGFGGDGITISSSEAIMKSSKDKELYPALVQQFVDTSAGIPGIVKGLHDLRVIVIDGKPMQVSVRQPAEGSLLANIKAGGSISTRPVSLLPEATLRFIQGVDNNMKRFGSRIYSIDMVFDGKNYCLMELNARPGWHPRSEGAESSRFIVALADLIAGAAEST